MRSFVTRTAAVVLAAFLAAAAARPGLAQTPTSLEEARFTLGEIMVERSDIYPEERAKSGLARLINATHRTTLEAVIQREIWLSPGEVVDQAFAEELERNLRSLGLFADVSVKLLPSRDPEAGSDVRDLHVTTRDRLSINGGAGGAFVGDTTSGNLSILETNVLGTGDRLSFSVRENDFGETRGDVSYFDRYLAGTWTSATAQVGRTEEGNLFALRLNRPFRFLRDKLAWSITGSTTSVDRDFFAGNDTVAEVPFDFRRVSASVRWRSGSRTNFWTRGLTARYSDFDYSGARGPAAASFRVPGDTRLVFAGGTLAWTEIAEFRKVTNLDTMQFVQDIQLGTIASLEAGALYRDEELGGQDQTGAGQSTQPQLTADFARTFAFGSSRYASARLNGNVRFDDGDTTGWRTDINLRAFDLSWQPHTLALAVTYSEAEETENLPIQLTLGEINGLRGYPNREFTGERFLRINFEDRIDLGIHAASFDVGAVIFGDAAWISDRGESFDGPFTSAGVGQPIAVVAVECACRSAPSRP